MSEQPIPTPPEGTYVAVRRWVSETTGRKTRKWYWEACFDGKVVGAGIVAGEDRARHAGCLSLAGAAYVAGLCDSDEASS